MTETRGASFRDRSLGLPSKTDEFNFQMIELAYENLNSDEAHQVLGIRIFDHYLDTHNKEITSSEIGKEAFFVFMHLAQHGLSPETRFRALSCLVKASMSEDADPDPLCQPQFLEFLLQILAESEVPTLNLALKLLSIAFGESSDAREFLLTNGLFLRITQNPALTECNVGELVAMGVKYAEERTPDVDTLIHILLQLLGSNSVDNICQALAGMAEVVERQWFSSGQEFEEFHRMLPRFLTHENEDVVSAAFIALEAIPVSAEDFGAVMATLRRDDKGVNIAMNYLKKTQEVWAQSPPPELLPALLDCIRRLPYERGRAAIQLIAPAMGSVSEDVMKQIAELVCPFVDDRLATTSVLKILVMIARALDAAPPEAKTWFADAISSCTDALEALTGSANDEQAAMAQQLFDAVM